MSLQDLSHGVFHVSPDIDRWIENITYSNKQFHEEESTKFFHRVEESWIYEEHTIEDDVDQ